MGAPSLWQTVVIVAGCVLMASLGSSANAFNNIEASVKNNVGLSQTVMNVVASFGLLGTNLNFIFGFLRDKFGAAWTGLLCSLLGFGGYFIMAYSDTKGTAWSLTLGLFLVGLGNGGCFLAALSTAIAVSPTGSGASVSMVATAMGLCIAITVYIQTTYASLGHCKGDHCWPTWCRVLGLCCLVIQGVGAVLVFLFKPSDYNHAANAKAAEAAKGKTSSDSSVNAEQAPLLAAASDAASPAPPAASPSAINTQLPFIEALQVFRHPYFLMLFVTEFICFVAAMNLLTQASQMWDSFTLKAHRAVSLGDQILPAFSYWNVAASLTCGAIGDLARRKRLFALSSAVAALFAIWAVVFALLGALTAAYRHHIPPFGASVAYYVLGSSVGYLFGGLLVLFPSIVAAEFGGANFGTLFGLLNMSPAIASFTTAPIIGAVFSARGSYDLVLFAISGLLAIGAALLYFTRNRWAFPGQSPTGPIGVVRERWTPKPLTGEQLQSTV